MTFAYETHFNTSNTPAAISEITTAVTLVE